MEVLKKVSGNLVTAGAWERFQLIPPEYLSVYHVVRLHYVFIMNCFDLIIYWFIDVLGNLTCNPYTWQPENLIILWRVYPLLGNDSVNTPP
jgi:hypothetical protein